MLTTKCSKCESKVEYLSELHLIPDTDPPEAGFEGMCVSCFTVYYHRFKQYDTEIIKIEE